MTCCCGGLEEGKSPSGGLPGLTYSSSPKVATEPTPPSPKGSIVFKRFFVYLFGGGRERKQGEEKRERDKQTPRQAESVMWGLILDPEIMT